MQHNYFKDNLPNAFTTTQYLRGDLFVLVHSLLSKEELYEDEYSEAMKFLIGFVEFVVKFAKKVRNMASDVFLILPQYF